MKEEKLIKQIAEGNHGAFEKFYNYYVKLVYTVAYSVTCNRQDAEDVTAEVFVTVWGKAGSYNGGNGKSWLCAIAKNQALTFISKRDRSVSTEGLERNGYTIDSQLEGATDLADALARLQDDEREIVLLYNAGYKHREISEIIGQPLGTVTWKYNQTLKKLKEILQGGRI